MTDITSLNGITSDYLNTFATERSLKTTDEQSFDSVLGAMMDSLSETNALQKEAESAEIQFALGESDNTHDLLIAQSKANVALQYTVAVRDKIIEAYRELMQMQI